MSVSTYDFAYRRAEIESLECRVSALECLLEDVQSFLAGQADADCNADGFLPNTAMRLFTRIGEVL